MDFQNLEDFLKDIRGREISEIVSAMQKWMVQSGRTVRSADIQTLVTAAGILKEGGEEFIKQNLVLVKNVILKL